jgi:transcriptional repressor NrdR
MIIKKDGRREPYNREKIAVGIRIACQNRPISEDQIQEMTNSIEQRIYSQVEKEVPSSMVGTMVMEMLREQDQVAYVRFASVYRSFKDVNEFMSELSHLLEQSPEIRERKKKK